MAVSSRSRKADIVKTVKADVAAEPLTKKRKQAESAAELDRLIHERTRLALVSALAVNAMLTFNDLKALLAISDGNLSAHARKLEDAGYIVCNKSFDGRVPRTEYRLTDAGRVALQKYIAHMEALIKAMKKI